MGKKVGKGLRNIKEQLRACFESFYMSPHLFHFSHRTYVYDYYYLIHFKGVDTYKPKSIFYVSN